MSYSSFELSKWLDHIIFPFDKALKNSHYTVLTFRKNKKKYPVNMNAVTGSKFVCNKNNGTLCYGSRKDVFKFDLHPFFL